MSRPIDVYFCNQEECHILVNDGDIPITKAEMVLVLQQHMGATGLVGGAYTKCRSKATGDRKWKNRKKFFIEALRDRESRNKIEAAETGLTENAAPNMDEVTPDYFLNKF